MKKCCAECDKEFWTTHPKVSFYCSRPCVASAYKVRMKGKNNPNYRNAGEKTCIKCGSIYITYNKNRKFCSQQCFFQTRRKKLVPNKPKRIPKIWKCLICSKVVERRNLYCSSACRKVYSEEFKMIVNCFLCKKQFSKYKAQERKRSKHFCSVVCRRKDTIGKGNPNWRGGRKSLTSMIRSSDKNKKLIQSTLKKHKFTCRHCGQIGGKLEVDHIYKFSLLFDSFIEENDDTKDKYKLYERALKYGPFWDRVNMQVLCKKCNWAKELRYRSSDRQ